MVSLTPAQTSDIRRIRDGQRHAYNWAVSHLRHGWNPGREYEMSRHFTMYRRSHAGEWIRAIPRALQDAGIRDACTAAKASVRRGRGVEDGLKYRSKKRSGHGVLRCALPPAIIDAHAIKLPRFGVVGCADPLSDKILESEPRSYEFVDVSDGRGRPRYVLYVSCRVAVPEPRGMDAVYSSRTVKGIDRGAVNPTVVSTIDPSDGRAIDKTGYDTAAPFKSNRKWYQRMQRRMSKMNKKSGRCRRLRRAVRRRMRRVGNRRAYAECLAAKHICADHNPSIIVFEDLSISGMTRKGKGRYKRELNREMRYVRHSEVERRVRNRAELGGITIRMVDPRHTSQMCSGCGHSSEESRVTRDIFKCIRCSYIQNADANAATNIGRRGLPTPPGDTHGAGPPEVGVPFVRREMDVRRNRFIEVGAGALRGQRDNTSAGTLPSRVGMEKERLKMYCSASPRKRWRA